MHNQQNYPMIKAFRLFVTAALLAGLALAQAPLACTDSILTVNTTADTSHNPPEANQLLASYTQVSGGGYHTCGLKTDLTLTCWGQNWYGQATPLGGPFLQVDAGYEHTCGVVQTDGSVACWGLDTHGQATPPAGTFTQVSAGFDYTCGVLAGGRLACWGWDYFGQATPPGDFYNQVSAGYGHTCGLEQDGTLTCWGYNIFGQATPPAGTFTQVSAGWAHTCGVRTGGTVACWGQNYYGQATSPAGTFTQVSGSDKHTCGVRTDGTVVCWGNNDYGKATPPLGTFTQVSAGYRHTCGARTDGTLACWGDNSYGQAPQIAISPSTLPDGLLGVAYNQALSASGGTAPYTFAVVSGSLPPGWSLSSDGVLSGTPTSLGTYDFTVRAGGANSFTGERAYTLAVIIPTTVYVDDDYDPSTPGWGGDHFDSIQDGINGGGGGGGGGTVQVAAGTYAESVTLNKDVTVTVNGDISLSGSLAIQTGTFTAPSGLMIVSGGFNHSGGSFDPNGGRVLLDNITDQTLATTFHDLVINDSLVGYWKLDEGAGTTAGDSSGYGHDGTLQGNTSWSSSVPATDFANPSALSFDGSGDYVQVSHNDTLNPNNEVTLSAWIKLVNPSNDQKVVGKTNAASGYLLGVGSNTLYPSIWDSSGTHYTFLAGSISAGTWTHLAVTWQSGGQMIGYIGGAEVASIAASANPIGANTMPLRVGVAPWDTNAFGVNGLIDDVRVYDRALLDSEISDLAAGKHPQTSQAATTLGETLDVNGDLVLNSGTLSAQPQTEGYWKLDDGTGSTTAADSSGNGYDGTLVNSPTWSTNTPSVHFSNSNSLSFDRAGNDYVNIPGTTNIDSLPQLSLSTWVNLASTPSTASDYTYMRFITLGNEKAVLRYHDYDGTSKLQFYMSIGGSLRSILVDYAWATGTWYHVAGTYDGSTMRLYLNGVEQGAYSISGTADAGNGALLSYSGGEALDGLLDDVRVYDRALSAAEVQALADGYDVRTHDITIAGDFVRNGGVFEHGGGTVTFDGSGTQTLDTDAITFYDLTVNSGSTLVDAAEFTVNGALTNNGTLQRTQDVNGTSNVTYFNTGSYGGVILNANGTNLGSTQVSIRGNQDCTTTAGETVKRCFDVSPTITSTRNAIITFYFDSSELSDNNCNALNAYHWNGSSWDTLTLDTTYDGDGRLCGGDPQSVRVTSVSDFSSFVLKSGSGPAGGPTAVTLRSFTARLGLETRFLRETWFLGALAALGAVGGVLLLRRRRRKHKP